MQIVKTKDYKDMSRKAANIVSAQVILYPKSVLGLATGDTPIGMYNQLANWYEKGDIDFSQVRSINLDEYVGLEKSHDQSYDRFMRKNFFHKINIDPANTFLPNGLAEDIEAECERYEQNIKDIGGIDLQVLGLGHNGHIGFNEPHTVFVKKTHKVMLSDSTLEANSRFFEDIEAMPHSAISMGMGTIMQAKRILLICSGTQKTEILYKSLFGDIDPLIPGSILQLHTDVTVVADEEALSVIREKGLLAD